MSTEEQERSEGQCAEEFPWPGHTVRCILLNHGRDVDHEAPMVGRWPWTPSVRSWSLPEEPGPEVTRLKAKDGTEWERCGETRWDQRSTAGDPQECLTFVGVMVNHGEVSDATQERTP